MKEYGAQPDGTFVDGYGCTWSMCGCCGSMINCPACGNNVCNGGHGELNGKDCPVCPMVYAYDAMARETGNRPMVYHRHEDTGQVRWFWPGTEAAGFKPCEPRGETDEE